MKTLFLILVVMDVLFIDYQFVIKISLFTVLIIVVMDTLFIAFLIRMVKYNIVGLNPCCNGCPIHFT